LAAYWQASSERFEAQLRPLQAHVRVSRRGMNWLNNARFPYVPVPVAFAADPDQAGWRDVLLPIESMEHGARQVLGFGAEMEVRLPLALRAEVLRLASSLKALHDRG
jgi:predicted DNA-binding transcriptional regulator YafY